MTVSKLYDQLEDDNDHNLAAILVAVAARDHRAVVRLAQILEEHHRIGSLPYALSTERYELVRDHYPILQV